MLPPRSKPCLDVRYRERFLWLEPIIIRPRFVLLIRARAQLGEGGSQADVRSQHRVVDTFSHSLSSSGSHEFTLMWVLSTVLCVE